jgi:hypothetical protein
MNSYSPSMRHRPAMTLVATALALGATTLAGCAERSAPAVDSPVAAAQTETTTTTSSRYVHPPYVPKPEDFVLEVQVLEQKCFGNAGCNVTFRLGVSYGGNTLYAGEGPYTVVYTMTGTDDPFVSRFTLTPPTQLTLTEEHVSTPPGPALTATVTQVF